MNVFELTRALVDIDSADGTFLESNLRLIPGQAHALRPGDRFYLADRSNLFEVGI